MLPSPSMRQFFLAVVTFTLLFSASSCTRTLAVASTSPIKPVYQQGVPVLKSQKKHHVTAALLTDTFGAELWQLPAVYIGFANRSRSTLDFSTANVTATSGGKKVRVLTAQELERKINTQAALMALATSMNAASQTIAASAPQTTYSYGSASAYGSGGYAHGTYSGVSTTYNPAASAAAIAQINATTSNQLSSIAAARDGHLNDLSTMLRRNTVAPGQIADGVIKMWSQDIRSQKPLVLSVTIDGETHEFLFDVNVKG